MNLEHIPEPSCLDAAYERKAIEDGCVFDPVFPENKLFKMKRDLTFMLNNPDKISGAKAIVDSKPFDSPVSTKSEHVKLDKHVEAVRELLKTRAETGFKKYGTNLERTDLKSSQWAQHLLEELLDAANYIHRLKCDLEEIEK